MHDGTMMGGAWILFWILVALAIAALVKYLFFDGPRK